VSWWCFQYATESELEQHQESATFSSKKKARPFCCLRWRPVPIPDQETGIYSYRARYFDQNVGRFITEDPIGFIGGQNFCRYVYNSPVGGWPSF